MVGLSSLEQSVAVDCRLEAGSTVNVISFISKLQSHGMSMTCRGTASLGGRIFTAAPFFNPFERPGTNTGAKPEAIHTATNALGDGMDCWMSGCLH
jgi:hypothetical protein